MAQRLQTDGACQFQRNSTLTVASYGNTAVNRNDHIKASPAIREAGGANNRSGSDYAADPFMLEREESTDSNKDEPDIQRNVAISDGSKPCPLYVSLYVCLPLISILKTHIIARGKEILKMKASAANPAVVIDFVMEFLGRNYARDLILMEQRKLASLASSIGWKLCRQLKHYKQTNPRQRGMGMPSEPQILSFSDRQFDASHHLPAGIPAEMSDMKQEVNRLKSFTLDGLPAFNKLCKSSQKPEILAANGFFYMQDKDKVKCAFCLGVLFDFESDERIDEAHRLRFSTCPLLLGLDVGNVPMPRPAEDVKLSQACSEDSCVSDQQLPWSTSASQARLLVSVSPLLPELERCSQLACRPKPPVSAAAASAACRPGALDNLQMFARSLLSIDAAVSYHRMLHPAWRSPSLREESLARSSQQAVPADLLASAGFFLDSELRTSCYWCGLQLLNWQGADDPWIEHARWSPRCCHLLLERGHEFVLASRAAHPPYQVGPHQRQPAATKASEGPVTFVSGGSGGSNPLIDYRIEPRYFKAREDFPPALAILQVGCDPDDAKTAQFLQLKSTGDDFPSYELFLQSVLTQHRLRQPLGLSGREFYERMQQDQSLVCNREPKPLGDDEVDWRACKVCMDRVINVTLLDCKHLCCCSNCAKNLDNCPLCRTPIRATMLVNMD